MKKFLLLATATLCCSLAFAQGAEDEEGTTLLFIPRVDVNPYLSTGKGLESSFGLGNTSFYSLFEGGIGSSNFSYSVEAHWLSSEPAILYANTWRSDDFNWLDWANITYSLGDFDFTVGKDILALGTFEVDDYDFDCHADLYSTLWNNFPVYQWGAKVGYNVNDNNLVALQVVTSPYGEKPFQSKLFAYSLYWNGSFGPYSGIWSVNKVQYDGGFATFFTSGNQVSLLDEAFVLGVDYATRGYDGSLFSEGSVVGRLTWNATDDLAITLKGGYEYNNGDEDVTGYMTDILAGEMPEDLNVPCSLAYLKKVHNMDYVFGGMYATYNVMENLRAHAAVAYNNWGKCVSANVGVTYFFDLAKYLK